MDQIKQWAKEGGCQLYYFDEAGFCGSPSVQTAWSPRGKLHHNLNSSLIDKWMCQYNTFLCYLPTYSPELNLIEIVWKHAKYHWREFMTWVKDELPEKVAGLLDGYGNKFKIEFG